MSAGKEDITDKVKEWLGQFHQKKEVVVPTEIVGVSSIAGGIAVAHVEANTSSDVIVHSCDYAVTDNNEAKLEFLTKYVSEHELEGLPASYVLPASQYTLSMIETPTVPKKEFAASLPWAVEEFINESIEDITVDAFHLPLKRVSDHKKVMYAASLKTVLVPSIEELVNNSGILLRYIEIQELCMRNMAIVHPENEKGSLFVYLHESGGQVLLLKKGTIFAVRNIDVPLTQLISEKVEKNEVVMEYNEDELLDNLTSELERSIDFCSNTFRESPAKSVIIAPSIVNVDKVQQYLQQHMEMPVFKMELSEIVKFESEEDSKNKDKCLFAIGACLRSLVKENVDDTEY